MNANEALLLCRYVRACCPQQAIDEYTPTAWADLLDDIRLDDAKVAVRTLASKQPFIAPAEIRAEVRRIRSKRVAQHPVLTPPPDLTALETRRWLRDAQRRVADGETIDCDAAYGELHLRDLAELGPKMLELLPKIPTDTHPTAASDGVDVTDGPSEVTEPLAEAQ